METDVFIGLCATDRQQSTDSHTHATYALTDPHYFILRVKIFTVDFYLFEITKAKFFKREKYEFMLNRIKGFVEV